MIYKDGRGQNKKVMAKFNLDRVRAWFESNHGSTIKACCEGLGLSYKTVRGHINTIQKGEK